MRNFGAILNCENANFKKGDTHISLNLRGSFFHLTDLTLIFTFSNL